MAAYVQEQGTPPKPLWMQPLRVSVQGCTSDVGNVDGQITPLPDLPRPVQQSRRMLIMINAYHFNASESHVINSLETFTGWCEQGDEVHVAVDTASTHLAPYVFAAKQRFFCQRLGTSLPVIVNEYDPAIKLRIAGVHRELVSAKLDSYDWFLYAEDDLALRTHHIQYLQRWTPRLARRGMLPHLMRLRSCVAAGHCRCCLCRRAC